MPVRDTPEALRVTASTAPHDLEIGVHRWRTTKELHPRSKGIGAPPSSHDSSMT